MNVKEQQETRRSTRLSKPLVRLNDFVTPKSNNVTSIDALASRFISPKFQFFLAAIVPQVDPTHFIQVVKRLHWMETMNSKLHGLKETILGK